MNIQSKTARFFLLCLLAGWASLGPSSGPAQAAETTYSYTGNTFNEFPTGLSCPPICNVTGWFTVAGPLLPNLNGVTITPLAFSMSSSGTTLTDSLSADSSLTLSTDASGAIIAWSWVEVGPASSPTARILTENLAGIVADDVRLSAYGAQPLPFVGQRVGQISNDPGTWTVSAVPEPRLGGLFAISLLVAIGALQKKRIGAAWRE
jgi:hypothetical protein